MARCRGEVVEDVDLSNGCNGIVLECVSFEGRQCCRVGWMQKPRARAYAADAPGLERDCGVFRYLKALFV